MASATSSLRDALAVLKREQAKTQKAIDAIEELLRDMDDERPPQLPLSEPMSVSSGLTGKALASMPYANMTLGDAAVAYLRYAGKFQPMAAIVKALWAGGVRSGSKSPYRMMYNILDKRLEKDVVKRGSEWGLKEWEQK